MFLTTDLLAQLYYIFVEDRLIGTAVTTFVLTTDLLALLLLPSY